MWFFLILTFAPAPGPFRTKLLTIKDQIQAYSLLDRSSKEKEVFKNSEKQSKQKQEITKLYPTIEHFRQSTSKFF